MHDVILVQEWSSDAFHRRVAVLEEEGYRARRETYRIVAETHPETGLITHLHSIEMIKPDSEET